MRKLTTALAAAAMLALPLSASAQTTPADPPSPPAGQPPMGDFGPMRANMQQVEAQRKAFRDKVLVALTPAHKELVARVVGQLAIAQNPDRKAAAAQIDAALSPGEKSAVLAAHASFRSSMRAQMQRMRTQMEKMHPGMGSPGPMLRQHMEMGEGPNQRGTPSAGEIVLMATSGGMMMRGGMVLERHP